MVVSRVKQVGEKNVNLLRFIFLYRGVRIKNKEIFGVIFGIILFIVWIFILNNLAFIFLSEKSTINGIEVTKIRDLGQIYSWLTAGMLPFFLIVGHYLLYSSTADGMEKISDIIAMKSTLLGFFIWLLIMVLIYLLKINISFWISIAGGYFTILIIFFLIKTLKRDVIYDSNER